MCGCLLCVDKDGSASGKGVDRRSVKVNRSCRAQGLPLLLICGLHAGVHAVAISMIFRIFAVDGINTLIIL